MIRVSGKQIEIRVSQPRVTGSDDEPTFPPYDGPAFFSFGFRPFFLGAALFAGVAVPAWIVIFAGLVGSHFLYAPREWHVHEMLFGFLPAVMTGFLLTAMPNWSGRTPLRGVPLALLWVLWLAGRLVVPKTLRDQAGIRPGMPLQISLRDGRIEIEPLPRPVRLIDRGGFRVAEPTGRAEPLTNEAVRHTRTSQRERRKPR